MPPREGGGECEIVVKVHRQVEEKADLNKFFRVTGKFVKKFYRIRYHIVDKTVFEEPPEYTRAINIEAIGVSRDLIYRISWSIECLEDRDFPGYCKPIDEGDMYWMYPLYKGNADACKWNNFERNSFVLVDYMEDV